MKSVVIQTALPFELEPVTRALVAAAAPVITLDAFHTQSSGIGKDNASKAAHKAIEQWRPELFIDFGIAGALSPRLKLGDVVLATGVVDVGRGHVLPTAVATLDTRWAQYATQVAAGSLTKLGLTLVEGTVACVDELVAKPDARLALYQSTGALAVCWEPFAVAEACLKPRIPFLSVRVISDTEELHGDLKAIIQTMKNNVQQALPAAAQWLVDVTLNLC
jgi:nucleoside phosphorylase